MPEEIKTIHANDDPLDNLQKVASFRPKREVEDLYHREKTLASQGKWRPTDSKFKSGHFFNKGSIIDTQEELDDLMLTTHNALDYAFKQECEQISSGVWKLSASSFYGANKAMVDEIEEYMFVKLKFLEKLHSENELQKRSVESQKAGDQEKQRQVETLREIEQHFDQENILAQAGTWKEATSYFANSILGYGNNSQVKTRMASCLQTLRNINSSKRWKNLEEKVIEKPEGVGFDDAAKNDNTPRPEDGRTEMIRILGLLPDATGPEIDSAYRRFVSANHPDRNGGEIDPEIDEKIKRLNLFRSEDRTR